MKLGLFPSTSHMKSSRNDKPKRAENCRCPRVSSSIEAGAARLKLARKVTHLPNSLSLVPSVLGDYHETIQS